MAGQPVKLGARFYRTSAGHEPVREWLKGLRKSDRKAIGEDIQTVQFGWPIGMPVVRQVERKLWEIRATLSDNRKARVLFTTVGGSMVLLHGFIKKSQRIPREDLDLARQRMKDVRQ